MMDVSPNMKLNPLPTWVFYMSLSYARVHSAENQMPQEKINNLSSTHFSNLTQNGPGIVGIDTSTNI